MFKDKKRLYWVLVIVMILFIWGNSMLPASISQKISVFIEQLLSGNTFEYIVETNGDHVLRKLAHFSEYALLAILVNLAIQKSPCKQLNHNYHGLLFLLVAPIDEFIQLFSEGRSAQFSDVCLDWLGFLVGYLLFFLINLLQQKRKML